MDEFEIPQVRCACRRIIRAKDIELYRQYIQQDPVNGGRKALDKLSISWPCCVNSVVNVPRIARGQAIDPSSTLLPREVDVEPSKFLIYNSQRPRGPEQKRVIDLSPFNRPFQRERFFDYSVVKDFGQDIYAVYDFWASLQPKMPRTERQLKFLIQFASNRFVDVKTINMEELNFEYVDNSNHESYLQSPANYFLIITLDKQEYVFLYSASVTTQVLSFLNDKLEIFILKTMAQNLPNFVGKFISKDMRFINKLFGYDLPNYNTVEVKMYRTRVSLPLPTDLLPIIKEILKNEKDPEVIEVTKEIVNKINSL